MAKYILGVGQEARQKGRVQILLVIKCVKHMKFQKTLGEHLCQCLIKSSLMAKFVILSWALFILMHDMF